MKNRKEGFGKKKVEKLKYFIKVMNNGGNYV